MTALIYTDSQNLWEVCSSYFEVYGHTATRWQLGKPASADVIIFDHPWCAPLPPMSCKLLVVISADEVACPPEAWLYFKPVDLGCMMDRILEFMRK